uniref:Retrotransposon Copia-like N-terminal domain-containing protein n=1 Tax=Nicotiana tabacum TaxID=4097 RepID=A0A1S4D730_TOBAC|nr:PREDICTED: uncharacterized protein LOC107826665 [Nicotiana tabacum]
MVNSTPDSSSSSSAYTPEPSSPLFLLPSDVSGVSLVVVPFSGTSFGGWRRSMIVSLSARNKIGFIDGSCTKHAVDSLQYRQWDKYAESVQYSETAESIWKQLNNRYGTVNGTKVFEIKREHASTYQGTLDIASYFNKLKKPWDELGVMCTSHANSCVCAAKDGLQKDKEEDRVHQFLVGLNEVYMGVRSNILMMQPLSSLDTFYNILLRDEKQRQVVPNAQLNPELASFNANFNNNRFPSQLSSTKQYTQRVNFDSSNSNATLYCKYCKKPYHTIEKCYKLHGFSPNFKFTKGKKFGTAARRLLNLLQCDSGSQPILMRSANFVGSFSSFPVYLNGSSTMRMLTSVAGRVWIVDLGATDHMTSNKDLLFNITPLPVPYLVSLPNGYKVKAHSMKKLLELGRMDQGLYKFHLNHSAPPTVSSPNNFVSPFTNKVQNAEFSLHGNVQNANHSSVPILPCATVPNVQTENSCHVSTLPSCTVPNNVNINDVLWHHRLGHVPFVQMKHIHSISNDWMSSFMNVFFLILCLLLLLLIFFLQCLFFYDSNADADADAVTASSIPPDLPLPPSPIPDTPDVPNSVHNPDVPTPIHFIVPIESIVLPGLAVRKSSRTHQLPSHLKDYVVQLPSASCSSSSLMSTTVEPHSYTQAAAIPA